MEDKKYRTIGTMPKSNRKIIEIEANRFNTATLLCMSKTGPFFPTPYFVVFLCSVKMRDDCSFC